MDASGAQMILGLVVAVAVLIFFVLKTKIHAFVALLISASLAGLIGGMTPPSVVKAITDGFGGTLGSIGIVIGLGVMMGRILEISGASERLAYTFVKWLGKHREEWAMAITGYIVSIPIFVDSAFVILTPLVKALSKKTGKSVITLGVALAGGLVVTHSMVPPTPGPLGVAGIFHVDVGAVIFYGMLLSIPLVIVGVLYAKWVGKKIYQIPEEEGTGFKRPEKPQTLAEYTRMQEDKNLPSLFLSLAPILIPIILIFLNTLITALGLKGTFFQYIEFFGAPIIAVAIGLLVAIYGLFNHVKKSEALSRMEEGIQAAGIILLVTGAGGALGNILRSSGAGDYIAHLIASTPIPYILIPFFISTLVRLVQGSGTVAMITAASISAPILSNLDVNMTLATLAATSGSLVFSYFNDSLFWVVNRMLGIKDVKEQMLVWSIPTTLQWFTAFIILTIASFIF